MSLAELEEVKDGEESEDKEEVTAKRRKEAVAVRPPATPQAAFGDGEGP